MAITGETNLVVNWRFTFSVSWESRANNLIDPKLCIKTDE